MKIVLSKASPRYFSFQLHLASPIPKILWSIFQQTLNRNVVEKVEVGQKNFISIACSVGISGWPAGAVPQQGRARMQPSGRCLSETPESCSCCIAYILPFTWRKPTQSICLFVKLIYSWWLFFVQITEVKASEKQMQTWDQIWADLEAQISGIARG